MSLPTNTPTFITSSFCHTQHPTPENQKQTENKVIPRETKREKLYMNQKKKKKKKKKIVNTMLRFFHQAPLLIDSARPYYV